MSDKELFSQLQASIKTLLGTIGEKLENSSENESHFSLRLFPEITDSSITLRNFTPHTDLFDINLDYQVQNGSGAALLNHGELLIESWNVDSDLSPPDLDQESNKYYQDLSTQLSLIGERILIEEIIQNLEHLEQAGATVELSINLFLDKSKLLQKIGWPQGVSVLLYLGADKLLQTLYSNDIRSLGKLFVPDDTHTIILMLGNVSGVGKGPNIRIYGSDHWNLSNEQYFQSSEFDSKKVREAVNFRSEESHWDIPAINLTPYHLFIEESSLDQPEILEAISQLRDLLSVIYMSDRVLDNDQGLISIFRGYRHVRTTIPSLDDIFASLPVFKLFAWAFENSSSDKLGIVRQIISLQLGDNEDINYSILVEKAGDIMVTAKSNFQLLLRRNVELYFDKRLKVSEFLQRFSEEVSASVSKLTSELISNLYKTVGVILGVVIAGLVEPDLTNYVAFLASFLYLIYILFILIYLLPYNFLKFRSKVEDYQYSVSGLRDILSYEEILRLQGTSFLREKRTFLVYFVITLIIYAGLETIAYFLMIFFFSKL